MNRHQELEGEAERSAALSKELSEFLLELSIGVHRFAMYPGDHPALQEAGETVLAGLSRLFADRSQLAIGVAQSQLVIEGVATEAEHPVLGDLARRLHAHQLGAVTFAKGAERDEVLDLLHTLAQDPQRDGEPLGLLPPDRLPRWPHVRVYPMGYERLEFVEDADARGLAHHRATHLWLGLARAAMASEATLDPAQPPDPETVAQSIQGHRREAAYDQVIVGYLLQLADELKGSEGGESSAVRNRVSALIRALDDQTLVRIVEMGGSGAQRDRFLLDANESLAADSVVKILRAAATASQKDISSSLGRLLTKLSKHAELGTPRVRDQADVALRENVEELLEDWQLKDPTPDRYSLILDAMARAAPIFGETPAERGPTGLHRLLQMSVELDAWGPTVAEALETLIAGGQIGFLLAVADAAPGGNRVAAVIRERLMRPEQLRSLLRGEDVDEGPLGDLADRMGGAALPVLLDALADSESRSVRRKVFDVLAQHGTMLAPLLAERLPDDRWFVVRNLLALLQKVPEPPAGFSPEPFLDHDDVRVRREAFALALRDPKHRTTALARGLAEDDDHILRVCLLALQRGVSTQPELDSVPPVSLWGSVRAVLRGSRELEMRLLAIKALEASTAPEALEALIDLVAPGKTLRGRPKLASPAPEVLAALRALSRSWASHALVTPVLGEARKSRHPEIREAAAPHMTS